VAGRPPACNAGKILAAVPPKVLSEAEPEVAQLTPTAERIVVQVDPDLRELIPDFLARRRREAEMAATAFPTRDYETLRQLGHTMKGVGGSFGFDAITEMGHELETAALARDDERIRTCLVAFTGYLERVEVVYAG
jgi:HPt (histidine-containing phosphotransfer) domain-containing protein